jgi:Xaa-Pro aminopeptidase
LKRATAITEKALEKTLDEIKTGMTEREVYSRLISNIYFFGGEGLGFDPIVAIDANASNPHAIPGKKRLKSDSILLIDVGAVFHGYTSDMTRTIVPRKSVYDSILDNLIQAYEDALEYYRAGVSVREAETAARRRLSLRGLDKFFIHSLGHGVGIDVHEEPGVNAVEEDVFRIGDVVTLEPGVYFPYIGGLRIENMVYVGESGPSILNSLPLKIDRTF